LGIAGVRFLLPSVITFIPDSITPHQWRRHKLRESQRISGPAPRSGPEPVSAIPALESGQFNWDFSTQPATRLTTKPRGRFLINTVSEDAAANGSPINVVLNWTTRLKKQVRQQLGRSRGRNSFR